MENRFFVEERMIFLGKKYGGYKKNPNFALVISRIINRRNNCITKKY